MFLAQTILRQNAHPSGKPRRESRCNAAKKVNFGPVLARCPVHRAASPAGPACPAPHCGPRTRRLPLCRWPDCLRHQRDRSPPRRRSPVPATMTRRAASAVPADQAAPCHRPAMARRPAMAHRPARGHWPAGSATRPACPAQGRRGGTRRQARPARRARNRANALASTVLTRGSPGRPARLQRAGNPTGRDTRVTDDGAQHPTPIQPVRPQLPVLIGELGGPAHGRFRNLR
jgi:hypothetical protein